MWCLYVSFPFRCRDRAHKTGIKSKLSPRKINLVAFKNHAGIDGTSAMPFFVNPQQFNDIMNVLRRAPIQLQSFWHFGAVATDAHLLNRFINESVCALQMAGITYQMNIHVTANMVAGKEKRNDMTSVIKRHRIDFG